MTWLFWSSLSVLLRQQSARDQCYGADSNFATAIGLSILAGLIRLTNAACRSFAVLVTDLSILGWSR